jgi:hypothetical protein
MVNEASCCHDSDVPGPTSLMFEGIGTSLRRAATLETAAQ